MIPTEGKTRESINFIKMLTFDHPEWIPARVSIMPATWMKHRDDLEEIVADHPKLFPGFRKGQRDFDRIDDVNYQLGRRDDCWGCTWENVEAGLAGMVVGHPLADWTAWESYTAPDPLTQGQFGPRRDWSEEADRLAGVKRRGRIASGSGLPHGFMYMYLYYLRGFENFMMDLACGEAHLKELIAMVESYNAVVIERYVQIGVEMISVGDDLGLQRSLPMSPDMWRTWLKPSFDRIFAPCRHEGIPIRFHTDGHILEIIPDLIDVGVKLLNPQIRANGLAGLQEVARGKVALDQDLDRQLFPFATPSEIDEHIGEVVEGLHLPEGGLALYAECEPDVPLANIDAICTSLERHCRLPETV